MECYQHIDHAVTQCNHISSQVERLRRAVLFNADSSRRSSSKPSWCCAASNVSSPANYKALPETKNYVGASAAKPLPLSDTIFGIADDVDALLTSLKSTLVGRLRENITEMARRISTLQETVMQQLSAPPAGGGAAEAAASSSGAGDAELMMSVLSSIDGDVSGVDGVEYARSCRGVVRTDSLRRRQSWVNASYKAADAQRLLHPGQHVVVEDEASWSFRPSASAVVIKQMDRRTRQQSNNVSDHVAIQAAASVKELDKTSAQKPLVDDCPLELLPTASVEGSPRTRPPSGGSSKRGAMSSLLHHHNDFGGASTTSTAPPGGTGRPSSGGHLSRRSSQRRPTSASGHSLDSLVHTSAFPPFPYAFTPFPKETTYAASWWHRVIHQLQEGAGTTVLTIDGVVISQETANAMLAEVSTEPPCLSSLVSAVLTMRPDNTTLYLLARLPRGCCESTWRMYALASQSERLARGSPILAARKTPKSRQLLSERLQFSVDRPAEPGLLETLYTDTCNADIHRNLWVRGDYRTVTSPIKETLPKKSKSIERWSVIPKPRGEPTVYFCTAGRHAGPSDIPTSLPQDSEETPRSVSARCPAADEETICTADAGAGDEYVVIDCYPHILCPTSYALCSVHPFHAGECPRSWVLEGSADHGATWVVLREHINDMSIGFGCDFAVFDIPPVLSQLPPSFSASASTADERSMQSRFCGSMFRVRLTGPNAAGTKALQVGALEFYGRALVRGQNRAAAADAEETEDDTRAAVFGCLEPTIPPSLQAFTGRQGIPTMGALPPPPVPAKGGKKGKK